MLNNMQCSANLITKIVVVIHLFILYFYRFYPEVIFIIGEEEYLPLINVKIQTCSCIDLVLNMSL